MLGSILGCATVRAFTENEGETESDRHMSLWMLGNIVLFTVTEGFDYAIISQVDLSAAH